MSSSTAMNGTVTLMDRGIGRILEEQSKRLHVVEDRMRRQKAARDAVERLRSDEFDEFFAWVIVTAETRHPTISEKVQEPLVRVRTIPRWSMRKISSTAKRVSFVTAAESYVMAHPEGSTTSEVGAEIGQPTPNVSVSLRQVETSRKTVMRHGGKWFPVRLGNGADQPKRTIRETIRDVMTDGVSRGSGEIFTLAKMMLPDVKKMSLLSIVHQMKIAGTLEVCGEGLHGAVYRLSQSTGPKS